MQFRQSLVSRSAILFMLLLCSCMAHPAWSAKQAEPPNVLWIIAEDMGPELGCYGTKEVLTPNLDALAAKGMRFTNAFTTCPVCSASRSAFITGMYQTTIGAHNHRSHRDDNYQLPKGVKTLPQWLRAASSNPNSVTKYFSANIRHLTNNRQEKFYRGTGKTDWNFSTPKPYFDSDKWSELKSHQPFYAQINFSETHRGRDWDRSHHHIEQEANPDKVIIPPYYPDHSLTRQDWAQYLNTVMALDKKVGFVLNKLKEDKLHEKTVVVFFGDHGRAMMRGKQWCYDSGLHIPLIIFWPPELKHPKNYQAGKVSNQLVEAIDFTATTLDILKIPRPEKMQGRNLFGQHRDQPREYAFGARDRCDETVFRIRTVRDKQYRYIRNFMPERPFLQLNRYKEGTYPVIALMRQLHKEGKLTPTQEFLMAPKRPAEELYDIKADPWETVNLIDQPAHNKTKIRLRKALENWIEESKDMGRTPEPQEVIDYWNNNMEQQKHRFKASKKEKSK